MFLVKLRVKDTINSGLFLINSSDVKIEWGDIFIFEGFDVTLVAE